MKHFVLFLVIILFATCSPQVKQKPNILFITVDDLNDWLGITTSHPLIKTPNLDDFFESAVYFNNAHCAASVCQASRNAMLTGLAPSATGWYSNYHRKTYNENQPNFRSSSFARMDEEKWLLYRGSGKDLSQWYFRYQAGCSLG